MSEYEREIELYDYIEVLLQYKWFILAATLLCGGLGWFFRPAPPPPLYEADAVVEVRGVSSAEGSKPATSGSVSTSGASYRTMALSDEVKRALIDSLKLPMSIAGLDGVLEVEVEGQSPGLRFSVQVHDSSLPIPILNAWLQLFAEGSRAVNLEDNRIAVQNLELVKDIDALEFQRSELDTMAKRLFVNGSAIQSVMRRLEFGENETVLQGVDSSISARAFLSVFDKNHDYLSIRRFLIETKMDSLLGAISMLEKELRLYPAVESGSAYPNPIYASIAERLSAARSTYAARKTQLESAGNGPDKRSDVNVEAVFLIAEQRRDIVDWFELRSALQQVESAMQAASAQRDQVVETMRERLRLVDDGRSASINFSELLDRAVASRQRAAGDIRVLSRALEVRTVVKTSKAQESGQGKTAMAAGVGLLLSAILSLLIEYVRKARRLREQGAAHE